MSQNKIYNILFEQESAAENPAPEGDVQVTSRDIKARKALDSVDDQIDALILKYESSSIKDEELSELMENSLKNHSLKYLFEQEADEALGPPPEDAAVETEPSPPEAPEPEGSEEMEVDEPGEEEVPNLDIDAFTKRSIRLIMNYSNLLRVEEAIINRIKNFLDENYGDKYVTRFIDTLETQYGISVSEFGKKSDVRDDKFAVGAYAGGTGGLGGGGGA